MKQENHSGCSAVIATYVKIISRGSFPSFLPYISITYFDATTKPSLLRESSRVYYLYFYNLTRRDFVFLHSIDFLVFL
jgi:hypothetical protein